MGLRITVMLNSDLTHDWANDKNLGKKIQQAVGMVNSDHPNPLGQYGAVVSVDHSSDQVLAIQTLYTGYKAISFGGWTANDTPAVVFERLMKRAASFAGYTFTKRKRSKKIVD